jgi:tetratricopeptide (TPR) repeat protein
MSIASNIFMTIGTHLAERLLFLPSIAYCLVLSYFIGKLFKININETIVVFNAFFRSAKSFIFLTVVILFLFTVKTTARNKDWKSNGILFGKDIKTVPNSAHMLMYYTDYLLNKEYLNSLSPEAKQTELLKAKSYIDKALNIYELFPDAHYLSGRARYELKDYEGSYKEYNRAFSLNPGTSKYHNDAGTSLFALGRFQEAGQEFEKAMNLNPMDPVPPFNLGSAYGAQGEAYRQKNDLENMNKMFNLAIINFKKAIQMKPDYKSAYQFLGNTYINMGDSVNGQIYLDKAAQIKTQNN